MGCPLGMPCVPKPRELMQRGIQGHDRYDKRARDSSTLTHLAREQSRHDRRGIPKQAPSARHPIGRLPRSSRSARGKHRPPRSGSANGSIREHGLLFLRAPNKRGKRSQACVSPAGATAPNCNPTAGQAAWQRGEPSPQAAPLATAIGIMRPSVGKAITAEPPLKTPARWIWHQKLERVAIRNQGRCCDLNHSDKKEGPEEKPRPRESE